MNVKIILEYCFISEMYIFLKTNAINGFRVLPGEAARLISPRFPDSALGMEKCLSMLVNAHGPHIGHLAVADEYGYYVHVYEGSDSNVNRVDWFTNSVQLKPEQTLFVLEAVKGGTSASDTLGDICVDDLHLFYGSCGTAYFLKHAIDRPFIHFSYAFFFFRNSVE